MSDNFINLSENSSAWNGLLTTYLNPSICSAMDRLSQLWDQVHMDESLRKTRVDNIGEYIQKIMHAIVKEEEKMVQDLANDISTTRAQVSNLRNLLRMTDFDESPFLPGSLSLYNALRKDLQQMEEAKEKAINTQLKLHDQVNQLHCRTGQDIISTTGLYDSIFGEDQLSEMRQLIAKAKKLMENRMKILTEMQNESKHIYKTLGSQVNLDGEEIKLLQLDFTSPNVMLSPELVADCKALNDKLKNQHDEWAEKIASQYQDLLLKLEVFSEKCCFVNQQSYPDNFDPAKISSSSVEQMKHEVGVLQDKYNRGKPIFDKLSEWMKMWKEKLANEQKACRASFYNNRGGAMSANLSRRKLIDSQLPKLLEELHAMVNDYLENNELNMEVIMVDGMLPHKYAKFVMEEYVKEKEMQKAQKKITKKCVNGRLRKTPLKKMVSTPTISSATSSNQSKRKRSISSSQVSAITPVNMKPVGPSTSSPKTTDFAGSGSTSKTPFKTPVKKQIQDGAFGTPLREALETARNTPGKQKFSRPWYP